MELKKQEARKTIKSKMKDLHNLIDKWEVRFLDTVNETIDEKLESVSKQEEMLKSTVEWVIEQKKANRYSKIIPAEEVEKPQKTKPRKEDDEMDETSDESDDSEDDKKLEELGDSSGGEDEEEEPVCFHILNGYSKM